VHDAFVLEAPLADVEGVAAAAVAIMEKVSEAVTGGLCLRVEAKVIAYPDRYCDPRGVEMWTLVDEILRSLPQT
jgi:hypothetical protein